MAVRDPLSLWWAVVALAVACSSPESAAPVAEPAEPAETAEPDDAADDIAEKRPDLRAIEPFDSAGDEPGALREIGAVPAWTGLIQRDRFLARRGDEGVVHGRIGRHDDLWFLHDETAPALCLGYRLDVPANAPISAGDRVVSWGAWTVDADRRWLWKTDRLQKLQSASTPAPARHPLTVGAIDAAVDGVAVPSARNGAGAIVFYVRARPIEYGRGWSIADTPKGDHSARLLLPGERRPYGGQMPPTDRESWQLRTGVKYSVEVAKFRRREGEAPTLRATSPPLEIRDPPE